MKTFHFMYALAKEYNEDDNADLELYEDDITIYRTEGKRLNTAKLQFW